MRSIAGGLHVPRRYRTHDGYVRWYFGERYPRPMEHVIIWEWANGMQVPDGFAVHHQNGAKDDNRPENLALIDNSEHSRLHQHGQQTAHSTKLKLSSVFRKTGKPCACGFTLHRAVREPHVYYYCCHCGAKERER
jgi:hypothetical protein